MIGRAVDLTRRMAALDPLAETAHRELIRRLAAAAGDRGAALAAFDRFRDRLAQELRIAPSAATRSLVEEIRAEREAPTPAIGLPPVAPPGARGTLVGREVELAALAAEWDRVQRGDRRVVAVAGEPGIGKTRMAAELCVRAHAGSALVLAGRAHEDGLIPYEPFVEALRRYAAECPDQTLRDQVGAHTKVLTALLPELEDRLGRTSTQVRASVRRDWSRRSPRSCVRPQAHAQRSCCSRTCIRLKKPARWRCATWCAAPKTLGFSCSSHTATPRSTPSTRSSTRSRRPGERGSCPRSS